MKKALPITLSIIVIVSITGNVLFYSKLKSVNTENRNLNATISEIQASMDDLENQLSEVQADLSVVRQIKRCSIRQIILS